MKKDTFAKFNTPIEKLELYTGGASDTAAAQSEHVTSRCEGTTEVSNLMGTVDADSNKYGDWYPDC
jgi:hypothetical protein